jgi:deazaflavin-dependent oxidoreductase (nitroreductase family)
MSDFHQAPWFLRRIVNPLFGFVVGPLGIRLRGGEELTVVGRRTGQPHSVPVFPMTFDGRRYLVAPRGQTAWARNLRAAGTGELRSGRNRQRFVATEVVDAEKPPILRAYLDRWYMEAGAEFGVPKAATLDDLAAIAPRHPVFRIERVPL